MSIVENPQLSDFVAAEVILPALLDLSVAGVVYYTPLINAAGHITDFTFRYLNSAAQHFLALPAHQASTYLQWFGQTAEPELWAWHCEAYHASKPRERIASYQANGHTTQYHLAAQRVGNGLVVSFTATTHQEPPAKPALFGTHNNGQHASAQGTPEPPQEMAAALREAERQRKHATEQQHLLHQILAQVPAAIATLSGPEHRYAFFNEAYQQLSANRTQLGLTVAEVLPEVVEQGFIGLLDRVYQTGEPFIGLEIPAVLQNRSTGHPEKHYVNFVYQAINDEQERRQGVLAFIVDTTQQVVFRQRAEVLQAELLAGAQRRAQERQDLYQVFEQAPTALLLLHGANHRIEYVNPTYERLFPGRHLLGKTVAECEFQPLEQDFAALLDYVYQSGKTYNDPERPLDVVQHDGQRRTHYFNFIYQAFREQGKVVGVSVFAHDVTDQVLARQQREAQETELQRLFEQAPIAIAILRGPELRIELANAAVGTIWGRSPTHVAGKPYFEAMPETAGQGFEEILAGVLATGTPFFVTEAPVRLARTHNGLPFQGYVNFGFHPLQGEHGHTTGIIAIGVEVTEQVLARQQAQELNEKLQAINQELHSSNTRLTSTLADLDNFVYAASHDLKAPITNIEGLLHALRQDLPAELIATTSITRLFDLMDGSVARFRQTIGHLTAITHLQQPDLASTEIVDLTSLVQDICLDLASVIEDTSAEILVDVVECPYLRFAPKNLRSIIFNLLSNALKYRDPSRPPQIRLRATCTDSEVLLSVQDNGLGLNQEEQSKLFVLFKRLHPHIGGSGVGLYAIKKIVENAGGTISVQSEPGIGTNFTVSLPRPGESNEQPSS